MRPDEELVTLIMMFCNMHTLPHGTHVFMHFEHLSPPLESVFLTGCGALYRATEGNGTDLEEGSLLVWGRSLESQSGVCLGPSATPRFMSQRVLV